MSEKYDITLTSLSYLKLFSKFSKILYDQFRFQHIFKNGFANKYDTVYIIM